MPAPPRILLIDDDPDHLLLCNLLLQKKGYQVMVLAGCEEMDQLTAAVEKFRPDLIFMDHDMHGICGMDLTRMLKSRPASARIPVIYFTSRDDIAELARQAGADGHFSKPFDADGLAAITQKYLVRS